MRRRRRNGAGAFVTQHPWMTFFLGLGVLGTVRVIARGWPTLDGPATPPPTPTPAPAALPTAPTTTTSGILGLPSIRGLYR